MNEENQTQSLSQNSVVSPVPENTDQNFSADQKHKISPFIFLFLLVAVILLGGVFWYFKSQSSLFVPSSPTPPWPSPTVTPELIEPEETPSLEVSSSTDPAVIQKELDETDLGSFEEDLEKLETQAEGL